MDTSRPAPPESAAYMLSTETDRDRLYVQFDLFRGWFERAMLGALKLAEVDTRSPFRVLDVACGEGLYAAEIVSRNSLASVAGVDRDAEAIATAQAAFADDPRLHFAVADAHEPFVPVVGEGFDVAVLVCALTHFKLGALALRQVFGALRPGGSVVLLDPTARMFDYPHPSLSPLREAVHAAWGAFGTCDAGDVQQSLLTEAGFVDVKTEAQDFVLGGATPRGKAKLHVLVELLVSMRAALVERARTISAADFDEHLGELRRAAKDPSLEGTYHYRSALARRPPARAA